MNPLHELKVPPETAIRLIAERIEAAQSLQECQNPPGYYDVVGWCSKTWPVIDQIYGGDNIRAEEIRLIGLPACSCSAPGPVQESLNGYCSRLEGYMDEIRDAMGTGT